MDGGEKIRSAFERGARAVELRPAVGQGTARTRARITGGLRCEIEDGRWRLTADMSEKSGGDGTGPDPGGSGRGALASCLAMGYVRWAANGGIPLAGVEVEVAADYDVRGELGVADLPPGYSTVRYTVTLTSDAPEAELRRLVERADDRSPYRDVFARPLRLESELRIVRPGEPAP